jgi:hypothetical protein
MSIEMMFYLASVIVNIGMFFTIALFISIVLFIILFIGFIVGEYGGQGGVIKLKQHFFYPVLIFVVSGTFSALFPSEKTMYMIMATHISKKSEIPEKVLKAIELKLDEYIDEVKKVSK